MEIINPTKNEKKIFSVPVHLRGSAAAPAAAMPPDPRVLCAQVLKKSRKVKEKRIKDFKVFIYLYLISNVLYFHRILPGAARCLRVDGQRTGCPGWAAAAEMAGKTRKVYSFKVKLMKTIYLKKKEEQNKVQERIDRPVFTLGCCGETQRAFTVSRCTYTPTTAAEKSPFRLFSSSFAQIF